MAHHARDTRRPGPRKPGADHSLTALIVTAVARGREAGVPTATMVRDLVEAGASRAAVARALRFIDQTEPTEPNREEYGTYARDLVETL